MRVLIKDPGGKWEVAEVENTLDALQKAVGGHIETLTINTEPEPLILIVDEEGRIKGKEPNFTIEGEEIVGTVVLCGIDGDEFAPVPDWAVRGLKWHKE